MKARLHAWILCAVRSRAAARLVRRMAEESLKRMLEAQVRTAAPARRRAPRGAKAERARVEAPHRRTTRMEGRLDLTAIHHLHFSWNSRRARPFLGRAFRRNTRTDIRVGSRRWPTESFASRIFRRWRSHDSCSERRRGKRPSLRSEGSTARRQTRLRVRRIRTGLWMKHPARRASNPGSTHAESPRCTSPETVPYRKRSTATRSRNFTKETSLRSRASSTTAPSFVTKRGKLARVRSWIVLAVKCSRFTESSAETARIFPSRSPSVRITAREIPRPFPSQTSR